MGLSSSDITSIVAALQESDWDEAVVVIGDVRIAVARNGARLAESVPAGPVGPSSPAPAPIPAPPAPAAPPPTTPAAPADTGSAGPADQAVGAPSVGVFWRAPEPGAAPFVEVGSRVSEGDTVGIVEIMKLMNNVPATTSGTVTAIHVDNGGTVEFGTPLVSIAAED